jgi:hypothetical protein
MLFRTIGGALAVGLLGELLARSLAREPSLVADTARLLAGAGLGETLDPARRAQLSQTLADAITPVFWVVAGLTFAAFLLGMTFPKLRLGDERGTPVVRR